MIPVKREALITVPLMPKNIAVFHMTLLQYILIIILSW